MTFDERSLVLDRTRADVIGALNGEVDYGENEALTYLNAQVLALLYVGDAIRDFNESLGMSPALNR
jgi:hypothetical protein